MAWLGIPSRAGVALLALTLGPSINGGCSRPGASRAEPTTFGSGLPSAAASPSVKKLEHEMFLRLNRDRAERGLPALQYDARLADVGRFHSSDMRDKKFFSHDSPTTGSLEDRLNRAGYLFLTARENLAEAPDVQIGQDNLLRSPGHYANIVSTDISHVGIGIVKGGVMASENLTITQVFATKGRAESPSAAQAKLVERIHGERGERGLSRAEVFPLLNELAQAHISKLDAETSPSSLKQVGQRVSEELLQKQDKRLRGVVAAAQLLPDSQAFEVPESLLDARKTPFGLAVRKVQGNGGRPMLQLLLLIGL